jgi:hypothetical protein
MEPVFDADGWTVAWIYKQQFLIDAASTLRAIMRGRAVFSKERRVLAEFADGFFWDARGEAIAFVSGATNGPALPGLRASPAAPIPPTISVPSLAPIVSARPSHRRRWSRMTLDQALAGSLVAVDSPVLSPLVGPSGPPRQPAKSGVDDWREPMALLRLTPIGRV